MQLPDGTKIAERWEGEYECASITGYRGMSRFDVKGIIEELSRAEARLAALQWQPITPENLPKEGDELLDRTGIYVSHCDTATARRPYLQWRAYAWTHFRPINPPAREQPADAQKGGE